MYVHNTFYTLTYTIYTTYTLIGKPFQLFKGPYTEENVFQKLMDAIEVSIVYEARVYCHWILLIYFVLYIYFVMHIFITPISILPY